VVFLLIEVERHQQSNIERQCQYRAKGRAFKEVANAFDTTLKPLKDVVPNRELTRVITKILQSIYKELHFYLGPLSKRFVKQKVLIDSIVVDFVLESHLSKVQNELWLKMRSLMGLYWLVNVLN